MPEDINPADIEEYGKNIPIEMLLLDSDNPRLYANKKSGELESLQEEIQEELLMKGHIPPLKRNIRENGTKEVIYVQFQERYGKYVVIEGNTRTAIHKSIVSSGEETNFDFTVIRANIIKPHVTEAELSRMKVIWQLSKQDWGVYEKAALMKEQHYEHGFPIADIARDFNTSKADVKTSLKAIAVFEQFTESEFSGGDYDTKKFSFFSRECPPKVRNWMSDSNENMSKYFEIIGSGRIKSIALSGGLRDFAKFVDKPSILKEFIDDEEMTVNEGVNRVIETELTESFKWMKQLPKYTSDIYKLMDPRFQKMIDDDPGLLTQIKALRKSLNSLIQLVDGE